MGQSGFAEGKIEKTIAERLREFCKSLSYDEIPEPVLAKAKELTLDTIGICVGSSGQRTRDIPPWTLVQMQLVLFRPI